MAAYDVYLFAHITAAAVWIGAAFLQLLLGIRITFARDAERQLGFAQESEWLGLRVYLPASLLTLVFGLLLVQEGPWDYSEVWVVLGFAALALSSVIGMAIFGPGWAGTVRLAAAEGATSPGVHSGVLRLLTFGWIDFGLLLAAMWVMALKPSGDDAGAIVVAVAIPVVAIALGLLMRGRAAGA